MVTLQARTPMSCATVMDFADVPPFAARETNETVEDAVRRAGIAKPASCHTFRHSFVTHVLRRDGHVA